MIKNEAKTEKGKYDPQTIEPKCQAKWEEDGIYQPDLENARKPFYNLMMFPYPSAEGLHIGSIFTFCGVDVYGRFKRMQGNDVFEPIGLDGFGIHSENHALKTGTHPMEHAKRTEENFYRQLHVTGNAYAWKNKVETYNPNYYKWTQWLFIELFKAGLAYKKKSPVNFCPSCKTVLADEQVIEGKCERCNSVVEKKDLEQWFFAITKYAERLLDNIEELNWTEKVRLAQRNWIGKKEGINIKYRVESGELRVENENEIEVFTTRPDTNFGATFIALAPEHRLVALLLESRIKNQESRIKEIKEYAEKAEKKSDVEREAEGREKTGVFTGLYAINDLTGYKMPIWISDFVLSGFGTGALVGVPGHDKRDFEFAKKFGLEIKRVVVGSDGDMSEITKIEQVQEDEGKMVNSDFLNGIEIHEAIEKMMDHIEKKGWGKRVATYHLRDWLISRQRYWGPPIPMIYCKKCARERKSYFTTKKSSNTEDYLVNQTDSLNGWSDNLKSNITKNTENVKSQIKGVDLPGIEPGRLGLSDQPSEPAKPTPYKAYKIEDNLVKIEWKHAGWYPEGNLPVELPYIEDYKPLGTGKSPLGSHPEFYEVKCPHCGSKATRETDVSDTFLDSAWYFLRYLVTDSDEVAFPSEAFIKNSKSEARNPKQIQNTNDKNSKQFRYSKFEIRNFTGRKRFLPVTMYIGGPEHAVLHLLYARFITMVLHDLGYLDFEEPFSRFYAHGLIIKDGAKMSKSKGNVINPDEYIKKFGVDAVRCYLLFLGPFNQGGDFRDTGMEGMARFLKRVWKLFSEAQISNSKFLISNKRKSMLNEKIKGVTEDLENLRYNTAIAKLMTYYNFLVKQESLSCEEVEVYLKLLAPFAPHMTEELWHVARRGWEIEEPKREKDSTRHAPRATSSIHVSSWPKYDQRLIVHDVVNLAVQVNGKLRGVLVLDQNSPKDKEEIRELAEKDERIAKFLEGKTIKEVFYVVGKILNFVVDNYKNKI